MGLHSRKACRVNNRIWLLMEIGLWLCAEEYFGGVELFQVCCCSFIGAEDIFTSDETYELWLQRLAAWLLTRLKQNHSRICSLKQNSLSSRL